MAPLLNNSNQHDLNVGFQVKVLTTLHTAAPYNHRDNDNEKSPATSGLHLDLLISWNAANLGSFTADSQESLVSARSLSQLYSHISENPTLFVGTWLLTFAFYVSPAYFLDIPDSDNFHKGEPLAIAAGIFYRLHALIHTTILTFFAFRQNSSDGHDAKHNVFYLVDCWWLWKSQFSLADVQSDVVLPSHMHVSAFSIDQQLRWWRFCYNCLPMYQCGAASSRRQLYHHFSTSAITCQCFTSSNLCWETPS